MRQVLVDQENKVVNVLELEEGAPWNPPEGQRLVASDTANIGDTMLGNQVYMPVAPAAPPVIPVVPTPTPPTPEETKAYILDKIAALEAQSSRALRELALGRPEAQTRLQQYDIDITLLRSKLV